MRTHARHADVGYAKSARLGVQYAAVRPDGWAEKHLDIIFTKRIEFADFSLTPVGQLGKITRASQNSKKSKSSRMPQCVGVHKPFCSP